MKNYLLLLFFFKAHLAYEKEAILITNSGTNALLIFLKQSNKNQCPSFLFKALLLGVVVIKKLNKDES